MATVAMIVVLLALMVLRVPVCAAMGLSAITGLLMLDMPLNTLVRYMATDVRAVPLLAIPFFILAGNLMNRFDMTRRIFDFLNAVVGYFSGGLAQVAVLTTLVFYPVLLLCLLLLMFIPALSTWLPRVLVVR